MRLKSIFIVTLILAGCSAADTENKTVGQEWSFSKSSPGSDEHVVTVRGHGKVCYVFVEDMNSRNAAALLWCDPL
jgi:hypothetical protein